MSESANLLHYMPIIVRSADISDWERKFCASMVARNRRGTFTPSPKQIGAMRKIVTAFQADALRDDDDPVDNWRSIGDIAAEMVAKRG